MLKLERLLQCLTAHTVVGSYSANPVLERLGFQEVARDIEATGRDAPYIHYRLELLD